MAQEKRSAPTNESVAENNELSTAPSKKPRQNGDSIEGKPKHFSKRDNKNTEWKPRLDEEGNPVPKSERKPKKKVAVLIGYCGSGYNGMQIQNNPDVKTIEAEIFKAFIAAGAVSKENSNDLKKNGFMRAARTDKGVHAAGNVVSCKLILEDEDIMAKINSHLPDQICVWGIERVNRSFDCRKLCSSRIYEYLLPTHSLIPPRPKSSLYNLIEASKIEHPGILRDDADVEWWNATRQKIVESDVTQEELEQVFEKTAETTEETKKEYYGPDGEVTEWGKLVKKIRGVENECRRSYRVSNEKLELFRAAMKQYEGSHNFHNFTLGKTYKDPSARRFMKGTSVSDPFIIEGTEWISVKIHGQSFMLHQIRKMICMASLVVRTGCPITRISDCFGPTKINIPKAPALGLLLECPVYETYNEKLEDMGYNKLDFSKYQTEMDAFKSKNIYDKIYAEETKENVYHGFFEFLDTFKGSGATKEGKHIFDFLGAAFNNGLENKETVKSEQPAKPAENVD